MNKIILKLFISVVIFFSCWFVLSRLNWVKIFQIEIITEKTEEKLGELIWESFRYQETPNKNLHLKIALDSILHQLCNSNDIDMQSIKLHILQNEDVNAFALPGRQIVIYTGLIKAAESPDELSGVIAHELAHIELDHIMKKLRKEIGVSALINMTVGNAGSQILTDATQTLTSTAYDRHMEKEADLQAVNYLVYSDINPEAYADFMYNISKMETYSVEWLSTHPDTKKRVDYINEYSTGFETSGKPSLSSNTWQRIKDDLYLKN